MASPDDFAAAGYRRISNAHCEAAVMDLGATVMSWQPHGMSDVLFCSQEGAMGPDSELHGGIPICAPWFGMGRDGVGVPRAHGLVRWVPWRLVAEEETDGETTLAWELHADDVAHLPGSRNYPGDLGFRHEVKLGGSLELRFTVSSPTREVTVDEAFHTYFAVPAQESKLLGLEGMPFRDHTKHPPVWGFSDDPVVPDRYLNRVYRGAADVVIQTPQRIITVRSHDADSVVLWNPGANVPENFGAEEWRKMVCVEVGNVQFDAVTIPAGGSHTMAMNVSVRAAPNLNGRRPDVRTRRAP